MERIANTLRPVPQCRCVLLTDVYAERQSPRHTTSLLPKHAKEHVRAFSPSVSSFALSVINLPSPSAITAHEWPHQAMSKRLHGDAFDEHDAMEDEVAGTWGGASTSDANLPLPIVHRAPAQAVAARGLVFGPPELEQEPQLDDEAPHATGVRGADEVPPTHHSARSVLDLVPRSVVQQHRQQQQQHTPHEQQAYPVFPGAPPPAEEAPAPASASSGRAWPPDQHMEQLFW